MSISRVYFDKKMIVFSSEPLEEVDCVCHHSSGEDLSPANLLKKAENHNTLNIVSQNLESAIAEFCTYFVAVEAAGGVVCNPNGEVLMILRKGVWDLPKGHIESGESSQQAAIREVQEETGLECVTSNELITSTYHFYNMNGRWELKRTWWYSMDYKGAETPIPQYEEGIQEVRWMKGSELWGAIANSYKTIQDVFTAFLRM